MILYAIVVYIGIVESIKYFEVHVWIGDDMKEVILKPMDDKIDMDKIWLLEEPEDLAKIFK